jgi:hypothetical protein
MYAASTSTNEDSASTQILDFHTNKNGVIRFENSVYISYSTYRETCRLQKNSSQYTYTVGDSTFTVDPSFFARRFAALEQQFKGH